MKRKMKFCILLLIIIMAVGMIYFVIKNNEEKSDIEVSKVNDKKESYIDKLGEMKNEEVINEISNLTNSNEEDINSTNSQTSKNEESKNTTTESFLKEDINQEKNTEKYDVEEAIVDLNKLYKADKAKNSGVTFLDEKNFKFDLGNEGEISGTYKIENNSIICTAKTESKNNEEDRGITGELVFKVSENKLTLITMSIKGTRITLNEKVGLKKDMIYSN